MKNKQRIVHMLGKNRKCEFLRKNNHCCGSLRPLMQHMHGVISTCKYIEKIGKKVVFFVDNAVKITNKRIFV